MANTICHFELVTDDPTRCQKFYGSIFDWKFNNEGMPGYTMVDTGAQPGAGIFARPKEVPSPAMNVYILVDRIEETLEKVRKAGGTVINEKTPIPGIGHWAMFTDLDGICVGIFEPLKP